MVGLGFVRAVPAATGRPGYDPRDLLKLYVYGYLNEVRSSRKLERECRRNVELMWLLRRLAPDFKTIADFRRENGPGLALALQSGAIPWPCNYICLTGDQCWGSYSVPRRLRNR